MTEYQGQHNSHEDPDEDQQPQAIPANSASTPTQTSGPSEDVSVEEALTGERERRRSTLMRHRGRMQYLRAGLVGLLSGLVAVLFQWSLAAAEQSRTNALLWLKDYPLWGWAVLPILGGAAGAAAGWLTTRFAPEASGSGIPHVKAVLLHLRPLYWKRLLPVKFAGGVLSIGGGLSLGREGPTVQMGAAVAQAVASVLKLPRRAHSQLIACGGGAGLAAAFNAPLAGFIFVIEELQRELSSITYGMALVSTVTAVVVTRSFTGELPSFHISGYPSPPLTALPLFGIVGLLAGILGIAFSRGLVWALAFFRGIHGVPRWLLPGLVGAAAGLVAWYLPEAVGGGHLAAEALLRGDFASPSFIWFVLILFGVKFALTVFSYGSGAPGGIFAPMLVLGALLGLFVGQISALGLGGSQQETAAFAVVGMAAFFSSVVRAPLTGIVLILEMTANYEQLFPLLIACLTAYLVAEQFGDKPIYEALLDGDLRRGSGVVPEVKEPVLVDIVVEPDSSMDGRQVRDLGLPAGCLLVTVKRAGREIAPSGQTRLRPGDQVTFIVAGAPPEVIHQVEAAARLRH